MNFVIIIIIIIMIIIRIIIIILIIIVISIVIVVIIIMNIITSGSLSCTPCARDEKIQTPIPTNRVHFRLFVIKVEHKVHCLTLVQVSQAAMAAHPVAWWPSEGGPGHRGSQSVRKRRPSQIQDGAQTGIPGMPKGRFSYIGVENP